MCDSVELQSDAVVLTSIAATLARRLVVPNHALLLVTTRVTLTQRYNVQKYCSNILHFSIRCFHLLRMFYLLGTQRLTCTYLAVAFETIVTRAVVQAVGVRTVGVLVAVMRFLAAFVDICTQVRDYVNQCKLQTLPVLPHLVHVTVKHVHRIRKVMSITGWTE